jgi:hypothetical protein
MTNEMDNVYPAQQWEEVNPYSDKLVWKGGLTKLEYFSIKIMAALVSNPYPDIVQMDYYQTAQDAVSAAKKLITELNK